MAHPFVKYEINPALDSPSVSDLEPPTISQFSNLETDPVRPLFQVPTDNSNIGRSHSVGKVELLKTTLVNLMSCSSTLATWGWGYANLTVGCKNSLRSTVWPARADGGRADAA